MTREGTCRWRGWQKPNSTLCAELKCFSFLVAGWRATLPHETEAYP